MEPIAACLALGDRLSWKMNDKYLVRDTRPLRPLQMDYDLQSRTRRRRSCLFWSLSRRTDACSSGFLHASPCCVYWPALLPTPLDRRYETACWGVRMYFYLLYTALATTEIRSSNVESILAPPYTCCRPNR